MCQRLGKRKRKDRFETVRQLFRNDTYGWNSFVNAVNFGIKFHGSTDEFCYYLDKRPARQKLYDKLWKYHNKTNRKLQS